MKKASTPTLHYLASTIFGIVTFVHALRLAQGWPIVIGSWAAPMWFSWIAVCLAGSLAVLMWKNAQH